MFLQQLGSTKFDHCLICYGHWKLDNFAKVCLIFCLIVIWREVDLQEKKGSESCRERANCGWQCFLVAMKLCHHLLSTRSPQASIHQWWMMGGWFCAHYMAMLLHGAVWKDKISEVKSKHHMNQDDPNDCSPWNYTPYYSLPTMCPVGSGPGVSFGVWCWYDRLLNWRCVAIIDTTQQ